MTDLTQRRLALIQWAQSCLDSGDWHGLSDAAMDLLVADARLSEQAHANRYPDEPTLLLPEWFGKASSTLNKEVMAEFYRLRELIDRAKPR